MPTIPNKALVKIELRKTGVLRTAPAQLHSSTTLGVAVDGEGNVIVVDHGNNCVCKIAPR